MHWWQYWWNILAFVVIPILTVMIIFIVKRKQLWIAPLISTVLAFITYSISLAPTSIIDVFNNNEWRVFFILVLLMQLGVTVALTLIAYFTAYILKRRRQ